MTSRMPLHHLSLSFRLTPLAMAVALLAGCSSAPSSSPQKAAAKTAAATTPVRSAPATLADLEKREIHVETGQLAPQTAEEVLSNYQTALSLFHDPATRLDTLRRMADLTMESSQLRDLGESSAPAGNTASPLPLGSEDALYEKFMQGNSTARSRQAQPANATTPGKVTAQVGYAEAVKLYQEVLKNAQNGPDRADALYNLAKAYDMNGQRKESSDTLRTLVDQYPGSQFATEALFRLAEYEFSMGQYMLAADHYGEVVKAKESNAEFRDQALYKRGWSLYKASDYEAAQPVFFQVMEELQPKVASLDKNVSQIADKLLEDTLNIISLGFIQQDGPRTVQQYFKKVGPKSYEASVYMNLGQTYLSKRMYRNAAETFEFFVTLHPFDPRAPEFSSATIQAFKDGGFPSEVIPAKENFLKRYGQSSEFWARANARTRENLLPLLQSHIVDLAKYWHATAQQTKKEEDYLKAANWYRQHLALNPPEQEAITINQLLAEALFAARRFDDAIVEFEKTAYAYPNNEKAQQAAYFALLSYHEQEKDTASGVAKQDAWWARRAESTYKYAAHFPGDKNTAPLLQGLTNDQIARKDLAGAMKSASTILQLQPPASDAIQKEAWMVVADGEFDLNRPEAAEFAYSKVLAYQDLTAEQRKKYQERYTASIYKQAEKFKEAKDVDKAVATFLRAANASADIKFKAAAEFDAATMYLNAERYAEAIPMLVAFRSSYPGNELNATIPEKLALSYEKTGQLDLAAAEYEGISANNAKTNPELAREALWTAAEMYGKSAKPDESARIYRKYVAAYPKPFDTQMEATYRLYNHYEKQGNNTESQNWLRELSRSFDRAGSENTARTTYFGAMAKFKLNQPIYDEFASIQLRQPLKQSLGRKKAAMQKALDAYAKTAAIGVAEFTTASNYQIAEIYRKLAADLMASERPKGLNELELEQYSILLEEQSTPFEDKALDLYIANANLAKQNIYDDSVRKSFDALAKLSPGRYNKREQSESFVDMIY